MRRTTARNIKEYKLEQEIVDLKLDNKEMRAELGFKEEKIDNLEKHLSSIENKLDKLIERSEERDRDIELRVKSLEQTITVIKYFIPVVISILGLFGFKLFA